MKDKKIKEKKKNKKRSKFKNFLIWAVSIVLILLSLGVAGYPFISDYVNNLRTDEEVVQYLDYIAEPPANKYDSIIEQAREYNKRLLGEAVVSGDPFTEQFETTAEYNNMLKIDGTDVMASVTIPKINVNLPIYHGTSAEVLEKGVGHLSSSSLPVGGTGTHCVISAHTGYSSLRLFSDLNQLEVGDVFYINCLGETMAYEVDQISIVLPNDSSKLQIEADQDYVTLLTCTPFGINTHRLLVRGTRIDIDDAEVIEEHTETAESTWDKEYIKAIFLGVAVMGLILLVFIIIRFIGFLRKKGTKDDEDVKKKKEEELSRANE